MTADDLESVTDGTGRERVLSALLSATRDLMVAESAERVAGITVEAADEQLGHDLVGVHLLPDAPFTEPPEAPEGPLEPVAWTDALTEFIGRSPPPAIERGSGVAWESFAAGELRVYDDLREAEDLMDPDTAFRSELHVPLGGHGLLITGSAEVGEFDTADIYFVRALAANATAALDNLASRAAIREHERELERQNERLERFVSVVSHDIRNPLSVAQGRLEMGLESGDRAEFERARDALDRLETLVDDLLTLAREGDSVGDPAPVDPATVAADAWETVETGGATLTTTAVGTVPADADRLRQLFENLFRNSVEHAVDDPADLRVSVGPLDGDEPAGFYVADDGAGIPPEHREQVFDHGVTTGDGGTGLGLTIVRTIAAAHGWSAAVAESEAGGARFEFRFDGG